MKSLICTGGIALAFAVASITGAEAQKKMTYQEAFAKCKQEIGASAPGNESLSTAARHSAGGACMHKYGFRLKKKAKI
jgi:hypothetical protein